MREGWINKYGPISKVTRFTYPEKLWPASGILKIADGLAVVRMEDYNPDEKEWAEADYFDKELNYLGKIRLPWFPGCNSPGQNGLPFYMKKGKLFYIKLKETETDEEYWLTRFRIES
ncbi:MAG: hypothetical protein GY757_55385 [bacterium]|nr:hypothetical protein [bacterium]